MQHKWAIILNPQSGEGKGTRVWERDLQPELTKQNIDYQLFVTQKTLHAVDLVEQAVAQGFHKIAAVGGDGTVHEVINGMMCQQNVSPNKLILACLPLGTGNDWVRTTHIPLKPAQSVALLRQGSPQLHDIGTVSYMQNGEKHHRFFINIAGAGFDAFVAQRMGNRKRFGMFSYLWHLASGMWKFSSQQVAIKTNENSTSIRPVFTIAVALCRYFGGGMKIAPTASPNDGLFDITLIGAISKLGIIREMPRLYSGKFVNNKHVQQWQANDILLDTLDKNHVLYLQADGELLGHTPLHFSIIPQAIQVLLPTDKDINA